MDTTMRLKNSPAFPACHCQTITWSCSGSIQIVLLPGALRAEAGV